MKMFKREDGQSVIMVVFILVVLIGLVALVLDIGNAYAQRRIVQNAADASAMAATRELARGVQATTNRQVLNEAKNFAQLNGIDPATLTAKYFSFDPDSRTQTDLGVVPNTSTRPPDNADGVTVLVGKTFNTYLAPVIGHNFLAASAESFGLVSGGACTAGGGEGLYPIAVNTGLFDNDDDNGTPTDGTTYTIWAKENGSTGKGQGHTPPGNFGWLSWFADPSNPELVDNMHDTSRSPTYTLPQNDDDAQVWIPGGPGVMNSQPVKNELNLRINGGLPNPVLLPIYDTATGEGNHAAYHIVGFGWFHIDDYSFQGNNKWISGHFVKDNVKASEGGCLDFGTNTVKLRPPIDLTRNIAGTVAFEHLNITQPSGQTNHPVDIVNVLDVSGSMDDYWGSGASREKKIATARNVLVEFNSMLRPDVGDRAGLVKYPVTLPNASKNYYPACGGSKTKAMYGSEIVQSLTSDIAAVNAKIRNLSASGWTPIAASMQKGLEAVSDPEFHEEGSLG